MATTSEQLEHVLSGGYVTKAQWANVVLDYPEYFEDEQHEAANAILTSPLGEYLKSLELHEAASLAATWQGEFNDLLECPLNSEVGKLCRRLADHIASIQTLCVDHVPNSGIIRALWSTAGDQMKVWMRG